MIGYYITNGQYHIKSIKNFYFKLIVTILNIQIAKVLKYLT